MKQIFLTSGIVLCIACPAFATDPTGISATNGVANPATCNIDVLGVSSGGASLEIDWSANISGAITLDAKRYASGSDTTGTAATTDVSPTTVYSKYASGLYSDSNATTAVTQLTTNPAHTGYDFAGFYTTKYTGGTQVIDNSGSVLPAASTQIATTGATGIYYAQWSPKKYTVTYDKGAHSSSSNYVDDKATAGATYDSNYTVKTLQQTGIAANTGYTFVGWSTDTTPTVTRTGATTGTTSNAFTNQTPWQRTSDLTVYAAYIANQYTVTYACGNGSAKTGATTTGTATYDSAYTHLTGGDVCEYTGHTFSAWTCALTSDANTAVNFTSGNNWATAAAVTCTATWTANSIGLTWTIPANEGISGGTGGAESCTYGTSIGLPSNPTKRGYTFTGWSVVPTSYDFSTLDYSIGTSYDATHMRWKPINGSDGHTMQSEFGTENSSDLSNGEWADTFSYGTVIGNALCSTTSGTWATAGTPANDGGQYCWCMATGYQPSDSDVVYSPNSPLSWVFNYDSGSASDCANYCALDCAYIVQSSSNFRRALFGQ